MVIGIERFREAFANFTENYVVIGGTACDIVLRNTNMRPRATDDIDMILIVENMTPEFGAAFWAFIKEASYTPRRRDKNDESTYELYRFENPINGYWTCQLLLDKKLSNI